MKKLVLLLAVAFSVSMFSCGGEKKTDECADTLAQEPAIEAPAADTLAAPAATDTTAVKEETKDAKDVKAEAQDAKEEKNDTTAKK